MSRFTNVFLFGPATKWPVTVWIIKSTASWRTTGPLLSVASALNLLFKAPLGWELQSPGGLKQMQKTLHYLHYKKSVFPLDSKGYILRDTSGCDEVLVSEELPRFIDTYFHRDDRSIHPFKCLPTIPHFESADSLSLPKIDFSQYSSFFFSSLSAVPILEGLICSRV